jgi:predicted enzyme related to lactoylglutathione lyase
MGQPVVHFEVIGKDPEKLREFYSQLFDWNFSDPIGPTNYTMVDRNTNDDEVGIAGGIGGVPEGYDGHVTFYVEVDDVGQALGKVEELGGKKMMGPDQVPEGPVIGLFVDPQGHTIGLVGGGRGSDRAESASERDGASESGDTERETGTESDRGTESGSGE